MRLRIERGLVMGLLSLMAAGGMTGCASSLAKRSLVGPVNGEGRAELLANDGGVYRIIPVVVIGCDNPGDHGGEIWYPDSVGMSRYQAAAWMILRKKPAQHWTIFPKGIQPEFFNNGNPMEVKVVGNDAFFAARPARAGHCTDQRPCSWQYSLKVEVPTSATDQTPMLCAEKDPMLKIRR